MKEYLTKNICKKFSAEIYAKKTFERIFAVTWKVIQQKNESKLECIKSQYDYYECLNQEFKVHLVISVEFLQTTVSYSNIVSFFNLYLI